MYLFTITSYFAGTWFVSQHDEQLGYLLMFVTSWATVLLAGSLYATLRSVDPLLALFALIWRVGEATLGALSVTLRFSLLGVQAGATTEPNAAAALVGSMNGAIFSGTTLFFIAGSTLFFWLFLKSRLIPPIIAASGLAASVLFGLLACANLLAIKLPEPLAYAWVPMLPAEIVTGLWLLMFGISRTAIAASTNAPAPHAQSAS